MADSAARKRSLSDDADLSPSQGSSSSPVFGFPSGRVDRGDDDESGDEDGHEGRGGGRGGRGRLEEMQRQSTTTSHSQQDRVDLDIDNLVGQICNRLTALESITEETAAGEASNNLSGPGYREARIAVFMDVMQCSHQEAQFYVDSAAGDVAIAVSLYVEQQQQDQYDNQGLSSYSGLLQASNPYANNTATERSGHIPAPPTSHHKRYRRREVIIQGLPPGWDAYVSAHTGCVVFRHMETQVRQFQVPPGYAELEEEEVQSKRQRMECSDETGEEATGNLDIAPPVSIALDNDSPPAASDTNMNEDEI